MKKYHEQWRRIVAEALGSYAAETGAAGVDTSALVLETPPKPELGDIAFPMFPFAKSLRKAPPLIAAEVARRVPGVPGAAEAGTAVAAGPYVNVRLSQAAVIGDILSEIAAQGTSYGRGTEMAARRVMLEFSCPNTNKPLHLGHLRNDAIGESLSRIFSAAGATLRKVNLINDRGVHICKSMLAYRMFGGSATPESEGIKGDHFVGDYYVKYAQYAKEHPEAEEQVRELLRD
jgi:arginyl-tRNA synthetase